MHALTLWPEWAWAVCHLDKRVENRTERVARMLAHYDGVLAIHAGKSIGGRPSGVVRTWWAVANLLDMAATCGWVAQTSNSPGLPLFRGVETAVFDADTITTSAIVATCRTGALLPPDAGRPWQAPGSWAVELVDVQVLPQPVPCRGAQGLWTVPEDIAARAAQSPERGEE